MKKIFMAGLFCICAVTSLNAVLHGEDIILKRDNFFLYLAENFRTCENSGLIMYQLSPAKYYTGIPYSVYLVGLGMGYTITDRLFFDLSLTHLRTNIKVGTTFDGVSDKKSEISIFNQWEIGLGYKYPLKEDLNALWSAGTDFVDTSFVPMSNDITITMWSTYISCYAKAGLEYRIKNTRMTLGANVKVSSLDTIEYAPEEPNLSTKVKINPVSFDLLFTWYFF